jgi:hypothetical protein
LENFKDWGPEADVSALWYITLHRSFEFKISGTKQQAECLDQRIVSGGEGCRYWSRLKAVEA